MIPTVSSAASIPTSPIAASRKAFWAGIALSVLGSLFLVMDLVMKLTLNPMAVEGTVKLGYPASMIIPLGIIELVALALYWFPRTSAFGALIWTGYFGGAVATHVRMGDPLFTHVLFPVYVATVLWLGLWLRDRKIRAVLPVSTRGI